MIDARARLLPTCSRTSGRRPGSAGRLLFALVWALLPALVSAAGPTQAPVAGARTAAGARGARPEHRLSVPGGPSPRFVPRAHTLARGETLASVLRDLDVGGDEMPRILDGIAAHWDVRKAQIGSEIAVRVDPRTGAVATLSVDTDDDRRIEVWRANDGFESRAVALDERGAPQPVSPAPAIAVVQAASRDSGRTTRTGTLSRGESLDGELRDLGVAPKDVARVIAAIRAKWNPRRADIGTRVEVARDDATDALVAVAIQEKGAAPRIEVALAPSAPAPASAASGPAQPEMTRVASAAPASASAPAPTLATERPSEAVVGKGETASVVLTRLGIESKDVPAVSKALQRKCDLRRVQPGTKFTLSTDGAGVVRAITVLDTRAKRRVEVPLPPGVTVPSPPGEPMTVTEVAAIETKRSPSEPSAAPPEVDRGASTPGTRVVAGRISSSFYDAAVKAGLTPSAVIQLANIFEWELDFNTELHRGDTFRVLQSVGKADKRSPAGTILAAEVVSQGETFRAFRIVGEDGRIDYVNDDGQTQRKPFLKSPLKYSRVSSPFARRRFHPVLGVFRPHNGVDFAAATGTPIRAVGDGIVEIAGWQGGNGRFVKIRHDGTYQSSYSHLSRIPKGLKPGSKVTQGQVIGFVGQSGLATGPHLHYAFWKSGQYVDPFSVRVAGGRALSAREKREFLGTRAARLVAMGSKAPVDPRVALAVRSASTR